MSGPSTSARYTLGDRVQALVVGSITGLVVRAAGGPRYLVEIADTTGRRVELEFAEAELQPYGGAAGAAP